MPARLIAAFACVTTFASCQAYSSNAGLVRSATALPQDNVSDPNDLTLAPIPGVSDNQGQGGVPTTSTPVVNPNTISVPGQPFTLRSALYEGGATPTSAIVISLWSAPLNCADYLANRVPEGATFVQLTLPPLTSGQTGSFAVSRNSDVAAADTMHAFVNTAAPQTVGGAQGSVSLTKIALGQSIEGSFNATLEDGSAAALTFSGAAAAVFCAL